MPNGEPGEDLELWKEIAFRVRRLRAAVRTGEQTDLSEFGARERPGGIGIDFRSVMSKEQIRNAAETAISQVAHLKDHLRRWLGRTGRDATSVDRAVQGSRALKIILDLSNLEKHGPRRDRGYTGKHPRLENVDRTLGLIGSPEVRQTVVTFKLDGTPPKVEEGEAKVTISGRIVDGKGHVMGDLGETLSRAVEAWERLAKEQGLPLADADLGEVRHDG